MPAIDLARLRKQANRLADFYNVPLSMGAFATGAKQPDWQVWLRYRYLCAKQPTNSDWNWQ